MVNRESESQSLLEEVSGSEIWRIMRSPEFVSRLTKVNSKTHQNRREYAFDIVKNIGGDFFLSSVREGDETTVTELYGTKHGEYVPICVHSHPPAQWLPSIPDIGMLGLHSMFDEERGIVLEPNPIGIVQTYIPDTGLIRLALYQPPIDLAIECLGDDNSGDNKFYEQLTKRIVKEMGRRAMIHFNPDKKDYEKNESFLGWKPCERVKFSVEDLLQRFEVKVYRTLENNSS